jgi:histidine ammonia-lyase
VAAILVLATAQAVDLRGSDACSPGSAALREAVRAEVPMLSVDRRQDRDIARVIELHRAGALPVPSPVDVGHRGS